jgi:ATP-dependent Clp protease, protease subunit
MNTITTEQTENGLMPIDLFAKLANNRILFLHDRIDDHVAADVAATLLLQDCEDPKQKISLFLNSQGGDVRSVFAIYDMIKLMQSPVEVICVGSVMHEAVLLLAAGTKGLRFATANAEIAPCQLAHESYHYSDLTDAKAELKRFQTDNQAFIEALAKCVEKEAKTVMADFERQKFMTPKQAKDYGLIDHILYGKKAK